MLNENHQIIKIRLNPTAGHCWLVALSTKMYLIEFKFLFWNSLIPRFWPA